MGCLCVMEPGNPHGNSSRCAFAFISDLTRGSMKLLGSVNLRKNRNRSIGAWLKRYELQSKGTGRRPSVEDPVDSIGIASPGVINCDTHNGKGIMRCRLLS